MLTLGVVGEGLIELGLEPPPDRTVVLGFGGDAANTAVMAVRLGAPARIGGRVGDDALGRRLLGFWETEGIDLEHVIVDGAAPTGIYANERAAEGGHRFDYHRQGSAGSRLAERDLGPAFFTGLGALHVTGVTLAISASAASAALAALERARAAGVLTSFAVNYRPALGGDLAVLHEAAAAAELVFASDEDARAVFGVEEPEALLRRLPRARELVLTRGGEGAHLALPGQALHLRPPAVEALDAAGAGDALAGAYLASRLGEEAPERALATGVAAAALSCRRRGCALSFPTAAEVRELLDTF